MQALISTMHKHFQLMKWIKMLKKNLLPVSIQLSSVCAYATKREHALSYSIFHTKAHESLLYFTNKLKDTTHH